jgi:hypothetical protein
MHSKFVFGPSSLEVHTEFLSQVFTTTVRVKHFDIGVVLVSAPGFEVSIRAEGFTLAA